MLWKLRYDGPLSNVAFNFNVRRYIEAALQKRAEALRGETGALRNAAQAAKRAADETAGA